MFRLHSICDASALVRFGALLVLAALSPCWVEAHEPGAHVHGVVELRVTVDGTQLEIGFERPPRTDKERKAREQARKANKPEAAPDDI